MPLGLTSVRTLAVLLMLTASCGQSGGECDASRFVTSPLTLALLHMSTASCGQAGGECDASSFDFYL